MLALGLAAGVMFAGGMAMGLTGKDAAAAAAAVAPEPMKAGGFKIDPVHSGVVYRIRHVGVSNFWGRFNKVDGMFSFDPANPSSAMFDITIDAASVDSNNKQRDEHLKSPDFFNTKQFPSITFKSKECRKSGEGFDLVGDMTLLGKTMPVTAKLTHIGEGDRGERMGYRSGVEATFTFKRSDFGMNYGIKGDALGDEVMVVVALEGQRQ